MWVTWRAGAGSDDFGFFALLVRVKKQVLEAGRNVSNSRLVTIDVAVVEANSPRASAGRIHIEHLTGMTRGEKHLSPTIYFL